ncbi:hypothetical protein WG66_001524 [Moniliophthora roreri]|uniref:DUF6533 domain-containing protein n=1 Tax=Moniliophthora roreri TaxID=221103 RepID=A0A0W0G5S6_MONRR|nr:hypothetical protein WG66_001524 [Moniliophthora roreri]
MARPPTLELMIFDILSYSSLALLIWDLGSSFSVEYRLIWKGPWTRSTGLYLWCRYYPIIVQTVYAVFMRPRSSGILDIRTCHNMQVYRVINSLIALLIFQSVLFYRIYILYGRSRRMLYFLICTQTLCVAAQAPTAFISMYYINYSHGCAGQTVVCAAVIFICGTATTLLVALTLSVRKLARALSSGWTSQPLLIRTMIRDNVLIPIYMSATFIPGATYGLRLGFRDIIVWETGFIFFNLALSLFVCRMIIHVKEAERKSNRTLENVTSTEADFTDFTAAYTTDTAFTINTIEDNVPKK